MESQNLIRQLSRLLLIAISVILFVCDSGDGDDSHSAPAPSLSNGIYTVCNFHGEDTGSWDIESGVFDADFDGVDTVYMDADRDGDFSDSDASYTVDSDGSIVIEDSQGAFSQDESTIALSETVDADVVDFTIGLRGGTGMSLDTFGGPYLVTKFSVNTTTAVAHTHVIIATRTGEDIGLFRILASSNPALVDFTSPFTYDVESNGNIIFNESHEEGKIKSDGSFFMASDSDPANNLETIMIGMKGGSSMANSDLHGEFIVNMIGRNMVTGDYIESRFQMTFDGLGVVHYEELDGGTLTGFVGYIVSSEGALILAIPPSTYQYGILNSDASAFTVVDTDAAGLIYLMMGIKKH